jgi:hypothetical protein
LTGQGAFVSEDRDDAAKLPSEDAVRSLRQIFERAWPVNRKPAFDSLLQAIDGFDREQRRRRKHRDGADQSG